MNTRFGMVHVLLCATLLCIGMVLPLRAQLELRKSGVYSAASNVKSTELRGWVTVGFVAAGALNAGDVAPTGYGWMGFYPVVQKTPPVSVQEVTGTSIHAWPQPASTHVFVRGVSFKDVERGLPTRVVATDVYGRQTSLPMQVIESDVVKIDVGDLAVGLYALSLGDGIIVRIGNRP